MAYFKEFVNYMSPFFSDYGFIMKGRGEFVSPGEWVNVFGFGSYQGGNSFISYLGVRSKKFENIFLEIFGWGFVKNLVLYIESANSMSTIFPGFYFDVSSKQVFPQRKLEIERMWTEYALPYYKKNDSLLAIQKTLRENEIFRPAVRNMDFMLADFESAILMDLLITKLYRPEEFDLWVKHYQEKCFKKMRKGSGPDPELMVDQPYTYAQLIKYLPLFDGRDWPKYRAILKIY